MKKIVSFALFAALLGGMMSCTDLLEDGKRNPANQTVVSGVPEGARVPVGFNVLMPVKTKAMTEQPTIETIHVFVFVDNGISDNGVLFEVQPAVLAEAHVNANAVADADGKIINQEGTTMIARWQADLLMGRGKRRLHFVANLPSDFEMPEAGDAEFTVLHSIKTAGDDVAYWQMRELENGILAYTYDGSGSFTFVGKSGEIETVNVVDVDGYVAGSYNEDTGAYQYKVIENNEEVIYDVIAGDYITMEGQKVIDGKSFYAAAEVTEAVSQIPLIRNFARIKVLTTSTSANAGAANKFHLDSAVLINTPKYGFAAPFDDAQNHFVQEYKNATFRNLPSHSVIFGANYPATIPLNSIVTACPAYEKVEGAGHKTDASGTRDSVFLYMFERGIPTEHATTLLLGGRMGNSTEVRWFKIEVMDEEGAFFPIYRDFTYEVEIKSISGSEGYASMVEAYAGLSVGDISNSLETQTLTKIEDGNGLKMWVEYIDKTSITDVPGTATLLYKFYDADGNYSDSIIPEIIDVSERKPAILGSVTTAPFDGTWSGETGWYQATFTLDTTHAETKISKLRIAGRHNNKSLHRDVSLHVMCKQDFTISATPLTSQAQGATTTLTVELPQYLGYSVFPLTIKVEAEANNLNPGDSENLSVDNGPSLFGTGENSFFFLKTINYSEYLNNRFVTIQLKTTRNGSTNTNATRIAVSDKPDPGKSSYFDTAFCNLTVN